MVQNNQPRIESHQVVATDKMLKQLTFKEGQSFNIKHLKIWLQNSTAE